jgi:hypothetical protein
MSDDPDALDDLLAPTPAAETPGFRDALFRRTRRRLAAGRWVRRAGKVAGVAAVFAAGVGAGGWNAPRERETVFVPVPVREVEYVAVPVPVVVPVPDRSPAPAPEPAAARTARALELDAEQADDGPSAAALYRRAGDAYLTAEQDYANAARCYRLYLDRAGDPALSLEPGDTWLLKLLKNAAFKEKVHATRTRD